MTWITTIAALGTATSAIVALFVWINARRTIANQVFHSIIQEYKEPEFMLALQRLYGLYEYCNGEPECIHAKYEDIKQKDCDEIMRQRFQDRIEFEKNTLHYQRRLVSNFYYYLCTAVQRKMIPRAIAYKFWDVKTLQVIPKILVPIRNDDVGYLQQLYDDAINYTSGRPGWKPLLYVSILLIVVDLAISALLAIGIL